MGRTSTIYLLHFEPAYSAPIGETGRVKTAGHYLGSTGGNVERRLAEHLSGSGSPLVRAAVRAGSRVLLADTWPGGRTEERKAKRAHHHARRCPFCTGAAPLPCEPS
jgi:hypothetical protein